MEKIIIYQMLPRIFGNTNTTRKHNGTIAENGSGKFYDIDGIALNRIRNLGCTHVWFTGVLRHATSTDYTFYGIPANHPAVVKGKAGSPYAIADYYDVDPDLAVKVNKRMMEFHRLVERTHKAGLKVIIDFVPNHVAREYHSICCPKGVRDLGADDNKDWHFSPKNNFYYCWGMPFTPSIDLGHDSDGKAVEPYCEFPAKATGNDVFSASPGLNDWYETVKLNYGIDYCDAGGRSEHFFGLDGKPLPNTWYKMTEILLYWAEKGVDAFRCDMAEMVPTAFWSYATSMVKEAYPNIVFIGEVYDPKQYRRYIASGFDYLYDKVGMYDTLRNVVCGNDSAANITRKWQETDDIRNHMLYFLENHDEQRIGSDFFAGDPWRAIPALIVSTLLGTNPFMLYAGEEFGEKGMDEEGFSGKDGRTTIFDYWSIDSLRKGFFARREMTKEDKAIEKIHSLILNIAVSQKAVTEGLSYDLMYANPMSARFDATKIFTFLRKAGKESLFVVTNFAAEDKDVEIDIPLHAFEYLHLEPGNKKAIDLISGRIINIALYPETPVSLSVPAYSGLVLKF